MALFSSDQKYFKNGNFQINVEFDKYKHLLGSYVNFNWIIGKISYWCITIPQTFLCLIEMGLDSHPLYPSKQF